MGLHYHKCIGHCSGMYAFIIIIQLQCTMHELCQQMNEFIIISKFERLWICSSSYFVYVRRNSLRPKILFELCNSIHAVVDIKIGMPHSFIGACFTQECHSTVHNTSATKERPNWIHIVARACVAVLLLFSGQIFHLNEILCVDCFECGMPKKKTTTNI